MKKEFRIPFETINNLNDEEIFWAVIEPIWPDDTIKDELKHIKSGTPGQKALYTLTLFMREIDNGGFQQFFWNSSGIYSYEVLNGFRLIRMCDYYKIVEKAFNFFPKGKVPLKLEKRRKFLQKNEMNLDDYFEPLNDEIYGEENLYPYFKKYIENNPDEFYINNNR